MEWTTFQFGNYDSSVKKPVLAVFKGFRNERFTNKSIKSSITIRMGKQSIARDGETKY